MMNTAEHKIWFEAIKADIIDRLHDMEGEEHYACDIGFMLTENENNSGAWYCSASQARKEICEHMTEFGLIAEYMWKEWEDKTNPFLEAELFHLRAMICLYENLFNRALYDSGLWYDMVEVNDLFIDAVTDGMKDVSFEDLF